MLAVPNTLLRFFTQEEYALQFIAGQIRFGLLDYYRRIEGSRRDEKEGLVSGVWGEEESDQNIRYRRWSMNPFYILCTSHPDVEVPMMTKKFGAFVVRISDPPALLERIRLIWRKHPLAFADNARIAPVVYNKDELLKRDPYLNVPSDYSYSQKPKSNRCEQEFRYVLTCSDTKRNLSDDLTLDVDNCRDICALL